MQQGWPIAQRGQVIGLMGGSFDPPHMGHLHVAKRALQTLGAAQIWWLLSPGNPLKAHAPAPMAERLEAARARIGTHPRILATDLEARLGLTRSYDTLCALQERYKGVRFVWVMGADNLASFHKWHRWQEIAALMPMLILPRPGAQPKAGLAPFARRFAQARKPMRAAKALGHASAPAWCLLGGPERPEASRNMRASL